MSAGQVCVCDLTPPLDARQLFEHSQGRVSMDQMRGETNLRRAGQLQAPVGHVSDQDEHGQARRRRHGNVCGEWRLKS